MAEQASFNAVIYGGACALALIIISIFVFRWRNKENRAKPLFGIGIGCAVWGAASLLFGFSEGSFMYLFDILVIAVAALLIVGSLLNFKKKLPESDDAVITEDENETDTEVQEKEEPGEEEASVDEPDTFDPETTEPDEASDEQ